MALRYADFGDSTKESELRDFDWEAILEKPLPEHLILNRENLSEEVSRYYRQYLARTESGSNTVEKYRLTGPTSEALRQKIYEVTNKVFFSVLTRL